MNTGYYQTILPPRILGLILLSSAALDSLAGGKDDPVLTTIILNQFEVRDSAGDNPLILDGQGWVGKDLTKLWFKLEAERVDSETKELELQILHSQAISTFWDLQYGLRGDLKPSPGNTWGVIGLQGVAPYFFEIDTALFIGESGQTAVRLDAEYEFLFTQQLILTTEIEVNLFGQNDAATGQGSGLSTIEAGLRLRYEFRRNFAPYLGVNWSKKYGRSADFARDKVGSISDTQFVIGLRMWF